MTLKTRSEVRAEFARRGLSYSAWAAKYGYSANLVIAIVNDDDDKPVRKCARGTSHNIAVQLGIKEGDVLQIAAPHIPAFA